MLHVGVTGIEEEEEEEEIYLTNVPLTQVVLNGWMIANIRSDFLWKEVILA
jgi:hypothetical protein